MTPQEQIRATLQKSGIPARDIKVFGSQVLVSCVGIKSRDRWVNILSYFCKGVKCGQGLDYKQSDNGSHQRCNQIRTWVIGGRIDAENPDRKPLKHGEQVCIVGPGAVKL